MNEFNESQKFNQWWLWLLNIGLFIMLLLVGIDGFERTESWEAFIGVGVMALTMILLATIELRTKITADGLEVKFWPFAKKRIFRSEIKKAQVRKYSPLREFGGWGYRIGPGGKAFNMYGNQGLQLEMTDGEKLMIGTQRPEELAEFMRWYLGEEEDVLTDEEVTLKLKELRLDELEGEG
ncbi:MAG: hypothetical protein AAGA62_06185 [Bacteroidota bacterium]